MAEHTAKLPVFSRTHPELIFKRGDKIEIFAFSKLRPTRCSWELRREMLCTAFLSGAGEPCMDQSVRISIPSEKLLPGFYEIQLTIHATESEKEEGHTVFGYCVDEMPLTDSRPADFEKFWAQAKAKLAEIPLAPSETFIREMNDAEIAAYNVENASIPEDIYPEHKKAGKVKLYKVQFDSYGDLRIHAWLAVPEGNEKFPGLLVLPGAGCAQVPAPVEHARHGYVALMLQIHGMDVDQESYEDPQGYLKYTGGRIEDEYYYKVYLACAQAVRYFASRPEVDANRLAVCGGSQGGLLTIVAAALCPNIKAAVSSICYYGYWPYRDMAEALNLKKSDGMDIASPPFNRGEPRQNALSYYDPCNFAPSVQASTIMCASLCDTPSPSTTVYAIYRRLACKQKDLHWSPGTNHDIMIAFERRAWDWLDSKLNVNQNRTGKVK